MFLANTEVSTVVVHGQAVGSSKVGRWLQSYHPMRVQPGAGPAPQVWRADFERVPTAWSGLFQIGKARYLRLTPTGLVSLFVEEGDRGMESLVRALQRTDSDVPLRPNRKESFPPGLTERQADVLSLAVALGYYEIPHRVSQRQLADRTGMSLSGLSALLRRAEAAAVTATVDSMMRAGMADDAFRSALGAAETAGLLDGSVPGAKERTGR